MSEVTRFVVVDYRQEAPQLGRAMDVWDVGIELAYQDDGRTLKVFIRDREVEKNE